MDLIRVTTTAGQSFVVNENTGAVLVNSPSINGATTSADSVAYTNAFGQVAGGPTTLYALDASSDGFVGGDVSDRGGARVATKDADGDNKADVVVGSGAGRPARVRVYLGKDFAGAGEPAAVQDIPPFGGAVLADGVFVG